MHPKISVILPAKREVENLEVLMPRLAPVLNRLNCELIVVCPAEDEVDCNWWPTDGTYDVVTEHWPAASFVPQTRQGKGNALVCGFAEAQGDYVVMLDADGSHDPQEIVPLIGALQFGAEFAKASRFKEGGGSADFTPLRQLGAWVLTMLMNLAFSTKHTDLCYGLMAFRRDMLVDLDLPSVDGDEPQWGDGFEIETLINCGMARAAARTREIASIEDRRMFGKTNLNTWRDGWRVLRTIVQEARKPRYKGLLPAYIYRQATNRMIDGSPKSNLGRQIARQMDVPYFEQAMSATVDPWTDVFGPFDPSMLHTDEQGR